MKKTIEQRAIECCMTRLPSHETADAESMRIGYIKGAEDQRKIDIRKACDAFCKVCDTKECEEYGVCNWVYNFEKALKK